MDSAPNSFPKEFRLKTSAEFRKVYRCGVRRVSRTVVLFALRNELEFSRFGMTVPKKLGKAHERNRIKRRLREILRTSRNLIPKGFDFVLNPRPVPTLQGQGDLRTELILLLGAEK